MNFFKYLKNDNSLTYNLSFTLIKLYSKTKGRLNEFTLIDREQNAKKKLKVTFGCQNNELHKFKDIMKLSCKVQNL